MALKDDIKLGRPFANPGVHALLLMARTLEELFEPAQALVKAAGISPAHFNVLRILRGAGPAGLPAGEIAGRMIGKDPDITRLLDRMARKGLVRRARSRADRRVVLCTISPRGLEVCAQLEAPLNRLHETQFERFGRGNTRRLIALLETLRNKAQPAPGTSRTAGSGDDA